MPANNSDAFVDGLGPAGSAYGTNAFTSGLESPVDTDTMVFVAGVEITETRVQRSAAPLYIVGSWLGVGETANGLTGQMVGLGATSGVRWSSSIATSNEQSVVFWRTYT